MLLFENPGADLFESGAQALVNPVNCVGAMGRGLALEFKTRFPVTHGAYKAACKASQASPQDLLGTLIAPTFENDVWVLNLPTKMHFKSPSNLAWVISGCEALALFCEQRNVSQCALPALGCGLGGLEWDSVRKAMVAILGPSDTEFLAYPPAPAPARAFKARR